MHLARHSRYRFSVTMPYTNKKKNLKNRMFNKCIKDAPKKPVFFCREFASHTHPYEYFFFQHVSKKYLRVEDKRTNHSTTEK